MDNLAVTWVIVFILSVIIEAVSVSLISIWFAVGAIIALIALSLGYPLLVQVVVFFVVSIVSLVLLLFVFKPKMTKKKTDSFTATNADRIIGQEGIVTKDIKPLGKEFGRITVLGQDWSAISTEGSALIKKGSTVKVLEINGSKAIVELVSK